MTTTPKRDLVVGKYTKEHWESLFQVLDEARMDTHKWKTITGVLIERIMTTLTKEQARAILYEHGCPDTQNKEELLSWMEHNVPELPIPHRELVDIAKAGKTSKKE